VDEVDFKMRLLWPALFLSLIFAPASAGWYLTYQEGVQEYDRGNLAVAFATYQRLAKDGDAESQGALGLMYYIGDAVSQNYEAAAKWFRSAAEQGLASAQYNLGVMYANGQGVSRSDVEAHKWFALAAALARNHEERDLASGNRNRIEKRMAAAELVQARRLTCGWWRDNGWLLAEPSASPPDCREDAR
jgi:TPR repeat protein